MGVGWGEEKSKLTSLAQIQMSCFPFLVHTDAVYDCSSLYQRNYRTSGVYKLLPDEFLGTPELQVRKMHTCVMDTLCSSSLTAVHRSSYHLGQVPIKLHTLALHTFVIKERMTSTDSG